MERGLNHPDQHKGKNDAAGPKHSIWSGHYALKRVTLTSQDPWLIEPLLALAGELDRTMVCCWRSDEECVVLEIPEENSKQTTDADKCTWRELIDEITETIPDITINGHVLEKPSAVQEGMCLRTR